MIVINDLILPTKLQFIERLVNSLENSGLTGVIIINRFYNIIIFRLHILLIKNVGLLR
jgi:hypothetical protein